MKNFDLYDERIVIFDLDGTLTNNDHRQHLITGPNKDWDEFTRQCVNDTPQQGIIDMLNAMANQDILPVILTGRSQVMRQETEKWLDDHNVDCGDIIMRPFGNRSLDTDLKLMWLRELRDAGNEIVFAVEDRDRCVKAYRDAGIVCIQVAEGNF